LVRQENLPFAEDKKPGVFYGYIVVLAAFVIMMLTLGINYTFGVFFEPLLAEFGWTRAVTSGAYSLAMLVFGALGIIAGGLSDRFGPRIVSVFSGIFFGSGLLLMSQVNAVWQIYLFYGLIAAVGLGGCWPSLVPIAARWFVSRRGLMTGIIVSGVSFGTVLVAPLASRLISIYDWRTSYVIIGIVALVLVLVAAQFLKRDPAQIGQLPYGQDRENGGGAILQGEEFSFHETVRTRQFWMISIIYFCYGFCLQAIMVHVAIYAIGLGISTANAANILAVASGLSAAGRIAMGGVSDRLGAKPSLIFTLILLLVASLSLQVAKDLWVFFIFAIIFGFAFGGIASLQSLMVAELFGLSSLGAMVGAVAFFYTVGGAAGPVLAGYIFDVTGSYQLSFWICGALSLASVVMSVFLKPIVAGRGKAFA